VRASHRRLSVWLSKADPRLNSKLSEGDNTILSLQAGRSLISSYQDALKGKALPPGVAYLARPAALTATSTGKLDLDDIDGAWATAAANLVRKVADEYAADVKAGQSKEVAMEACSQARFVAAKVHTVGYIFRAVRSIASIAPAPWSVLRADLVACPSVSSARRSTTCRPRLRRTFWSSTAGCTACIRSRSRPAPSSSVRPSGL
jgi:hypothetical protein